MVWMNHKYLPKIGLIIAAIVSIATVVCLFIWLRGRSYVVTNVGYEVIQREFVARKFIPVQARAISAWIAPGRMSIVAAFAIDEDEFVAWADRQGWPLKAIAQTRVQNISKRCDPNDAVTIPDGLLHKWQRVPTDPGGTIRIYAYDRTDGVGYFTQIGD